MRTGEINRSLPAGVKVLTVYDCTNLVDKAIATAKKHLVEGATLAAVILFLGNLRAALIIPLSMLFTFKGMVHLRISANLMSLGALDFGIVIDGAVVTVENCVRWLAHAREVCGRLLTRSERLHEVFAAAREARWPLLFGQLIIMAVYLPIFALTGVEGKVFHPMALTVVIALAGAMLLSIAFISAPLPSSWAVSANVRGRDIGSLVGEAQQRLQGLQLPAGYRTRWDCTFENLESARQRLQIVVVVALLLVFVLLFAMFGNVRDGLIVFTGIPFALTGGILALWLRGIPLLISTAW